MTETRFVNRDLPDDLLNYFALKGGVLHWSATEVKTSSNFRNRRAPWGEVAGGRAVYGRGRLITFARCALLTSDIAYALTHGGEWPWQIGAGPQAEGAPHDIEIMRALIRSRFALRDDDDVVIWRTDRGYTNGGLPQYEAGSVVLGFALSGFRGRMLTTGGVGFLACDVVNVLKYNVFPFEWD